LLRVSPFSFFPANGFSNQSYTPVDLNRFLATGDIWQSTGGQMSSQEYLQTMQAQLLGALLMQLDPMMLVQMIMASMLNNAMSGGGGMNRGAMNGGFSNRRSIGNGGWPRTRSQASHGHDHSRTDGPRSSGQRGIPDGLRPNAARGARVVREMGFTGTIGGLGHRAGRSDHPHGNAIDVMTHGNVAQGRQIAEHFRQNHDELGVKYVIYQQQIASPRTGWQWRRMEDRGSPTANHMDHPHISFY
jgi:hypothetical protein